MKTFLLWYLTILFTGILYLPFSMLLFRDWHDRGWIFSKSLGILCGGYVMWVFSTAHILRFTAGASCFSLLCPAAAAAIVLVFRDKRDRILHRIPVKRILAEEAVFFALLALSVYVIGFRPEAFGTEKFMDYGFLTSMLRSDYMPPSDPWYAGETINYYYGGQYLTAYLIRLSGVSAGEGYTFMRGLITSLSFMLPFSLVSQMLRDRLSAETLSPKAGILAESSGGALAGLAAAFCGNGHYVIYGLILPLWYRIRRIDSKYFYWFPDSTRFIGYNPDTPDKTIHEFPAYSSVLGDLHAHYINILFVILVTAAAYSWARKVLSKKQDAAVPGANMRSGNPGEDRTAGKSGSKTAAAILKAVFAPEIIFIGAVTGLFRWTNFWDYPIYFVVCGAVIFFVNLKLYAGDGESFQDVMLYQAIAMFVIGMAAAYPFTHTFSQIATDIRRTHAHTPLWQLLILWGLPVTISLCFILARVREACRVIPDTEKKNPFRRFISWLFAFFRGLPLPDLCAMLFSLCAMGLVWLPEVVYVKDIYGESHHRANTMFKLTYQAFILFAIVMGYVLVRTLAVRPPAVQPLSKLPFPEHSLPEHPLPGRPLPEHPLPERPLPERRLPERSLTEHLKKAGKSGKRSVRIGAAASAAGILLLLLTGGYIIHSTRAWFGNILEAENRIGSDAAVFVQQHFPDDYDAIQWINSSVDGQPVMLEANGDSYSDYCRVSVATGLPTVLGWYVHEWLWRGDPEDLNGRAVDIEIIYTGTDREEVLNLIRKYDIRYIYIGTLERQKFPELNDVLLQEIGTAVYSDDTAYILEMY